MERKVVTVSEIQPIKEGQGAKGPWKMAGFKSEGLTYKTFRQDLFASIIAGATLDIEFETKVNGEFTDRTINNIYINGQPIIQPKGGFGGGFKGGGFKDSASIEAQVALKEIGEAIRANIETPADLTAAYWSWIRTRMAVTPPPAAKPANQPTPAPEQPKPTIIPPDIFSDGQPSSEQVDESVRLTTWDNFYSQAKLGGYEKFFCDALFTLTKRAYKTLPAGPPQEVTTKWLNEQLGLIQRTNAQKKAKTGAS